MFDHDVMNTAPDYYLADEAKRATVAQLQASAESGDSRVRQFTLTELANRARQAGTHEGTIIQPWLGALGLRHQGVVLSALRGCDTCSKDHPSKALTRVLRADVLRAHCGDPAKSRSFIEQVDEDEFEARADAFAKHLDDLPLHYVMHFAHAAEIIGYKHPEHYTGARWSRFYRHVCRKLHVNYETEAQLDDRLNSSEEDFARAQ